MVYQWKTNERWDGMVVGHNFSFVLIIENKTSPQIEVLGLCLKVILLVFKHHKP